MINFKLFLERSLTPSEKRKREKVAKAIARDNPSMPMDKKMAIATSVAKKESTTVRQDPDIKHRKGTQPAKYYSDKMSPDTKAKRDAHFKAKKSGPAPGDHGAKTKPSQYTKYVRNLINDSVNIKKANKKIEREKELDKKKHDAARDLARLKDVRAKNMKTEASFADKSKASGISVPTLKKVFARGVAAHKTGHRPGTTPTQWGHARVNAFIAKKKKGTLNHDKDLA